MGFDGGPQASGYYVAPYDDVPRPEPVMDLRAMAPCGGLASTAADLARWSAFVADPASDVLSPDTLEEMCQPQAMIDVVGWTAGMGLGFFLVRSQAGRTWVGHTGGMPGHITGVFTHRESGTGAIVLMNSSSAPDPAAFAVELGEHVVPHDPAEAEPWTPGTDLPAELAGLRGVWFTRGHAVRVLGRRRAARGPAPGPAEGPARPRSSSGSATTSTAPSRAGSAASCCGSPATTPGCPVKLNWATYLCTREPLAFGEETRDRGTSRTCAATDPLTGPIARAGPRSGRPSQVAL